MKFRLPPECLGLSLGGNILAVAADGILETDEKAEAALAAHGVEPIGEEGAAEPRPARGKTRQDKKA